MPLRFRNGAMVAVCPNDHVQDGAVVPDIGLTPFAASDTFLLVEDEPGKPRPLPVKVLRCGICGHLELLAREATSEEKVRRSAAPLADSLLISLPGVPDVETKGP
jgi:hypothetical protein